MPPTARPTVAIDVTPLLGARTGIGNAVGEIVAALRGSKPGPTSFRTRSAPARARQRDAVPPDTRFVPIPARVLLRSWARIRRTAHRPLAEPAEVLHATNYLAPPSRLPTLVSVYDCSFVRYPELCTPEVRAFDPIVRRAVARGATVHTGSEFVADEIEEIFGTGLRAAGRLVVIPLGIPPLGDAAEMPAGRRGGASAAHPFVARDRHARTAQEPRPPRRRVRRARGAPSPTSASSSPVTTARPGPRSTPRSPASRPGARTRVVLAGNVADAGRRALLDARRCSRTRRSTRASASRCSKR